MDKIDKLEYIIANTSYEDLADIFDTVLMKLNHLPDGVLGILDIAYIEPEDDETDGEWLKRIKNTEYGKVESFCNNCKKNNTIETLDIAREKGKLLEFFEYIFGTDNFKSVDDFCNKINKDNLLDENQISAVSDIIYTLQLEDF